MTTLDQHKRFTSDATLDNWTGHHPPGSQAVIDAHQAVRAGARNFLQVLQDNLPEGPDKTIALRKAQETMWAANSAIACNHPDNQPV